MHTCDLNYKHTFTETKMLMVPNGTTGYEKVDDEEIYERFHDFHNTILRADNRECMIPGPALGFWRPCANFFYGGPPY